MEPLHNTIPPYFTLSTRILNIQLRNNLQHICPESSEYILIFSVDGIEQHTPNLCSSKCIIYFRASSMVRISLCGASAIVSGHKFSLGSFSCRFIELLKGDVDVQIGSIAIEVKLSAVKCVDSIIFGNCKIPPDAVMDVLESAVKDMMGMMDHIADQNHRLKFKGQCSILFSVYKAWKPEVADYKYILKLVESLSTLCSLGKSHLFKAVQFPDAVGKPAVQVASLIDDHGRSSLEEGWFDDMAECYRIIRERCEDLQ